MKTLMVAAPLALALGLAVPASAQQQQGQQQGLVNVNISNVAVDIADALNISLQALNDAIKDNTVQVPVGVAANVCDVSANVLAQQAKDGTAECEAKQTNQALNQAAKRQLG